jgi:hypothetical protein
MVWRLISTFLLACGSTGAAFAQCQPLPNNLTNGSNADATQVMANFNGILSCPLFTGNVGIGTTNAIAPLTVNASTDHVLNVRGDPTNFGLPASLLGPILQGVNSAQNSIEPMTLFASSILLMGGNVGIGTTTPSSTLYVNGSAGGTQAWSSPSDLRLKTDIVPLVDGLKLVMELQPVRYHWRPASERDIGRTLDLPVDHPQIGFIAQDVAHIVPEAVVAPAKDAPDGTYALRASALVPVLVEAIKQQQAQIDELRRDLAVLKSEKVKEVSLHPRQAPQ